jgi:hypothetical protein
VKILTSKLLPFILKVLQFNMINYIKYIGDNIWSPNVDLAICTIEKANSLLNRVIEEKLFFDIGFIIIDEFHLVI